jgi:CRP-like cAMP-binding protein
MSFIGQGMYGAFAEALEPSSLCVMSRRDLEDLIMRTPMVGIRFMNAIAGRLEEAEIRLEDLAFKSLAGRLASLILRQAGETSMTVTGLTHNEMAETVGTSRETATQALNDLKSRGLISIGRKRNDILDIDGLIDVAETY